MKSPALRHSALAALVALAILAIARAEEPPVAEPVDAGQPPTVAPQSALPSDEDRRQAARQTLQRLMEEQRYEEAEVIAGQVVELAVQLDGERSTGLGLALADLASAQMHNGDLAEAEADYLAALAIIEKAEGTASPLLIVPLVGLGETYLRGGFHQQANDAYQRALLLTRVDSGFSNLEQIALLDGLSESYLKLDKLSEANAQQRIQVGIYERRFGPDDPQVADAWFKLGRWYNRTGQYPEARLAYQEGRRVIRNTRGDKDYAFIDALIAEALTYGNEGELPAASGTLKRALAIVDAQPERDPLKRAEVLVAMGDVHVVFRRPATARQHYLEAWRELSGEEPRLSAQREAYFARPARITGPRLPEAVDATGKDQAAVPRAAAGYENGLVVARFTVDTDGLAREATIIESNPPGLLDSRVLKALAGGSFRPSISDGKVVRSEDVLFRHEFRYLPGRRKSDGDAAEPSRKSERGAPIAYPEAPDEEPPP